MEIRFLSHVEKTDTCWLWTMPLNPMGYGQLTINGRTQPAHRLAYELWVGKIPDGLVVRHKCRNRHCVNPDHLETGTYVENMADKVRDGTLINGDKHYARIHPEKMARGERHGSVTHPEALIRGDEWKETHTEHIEAISGCKNRLSKFDEDDVRNIRILSGFAFTHKELAREYGVSRPVISKIIRGESYASII